MADEKLKQLFPGVEPELDLTDTKVLLSVASVLTFPVGRAGSLQLAMLADCLLTAAYYRSLLLKSQFESDGYLSSLKDVVGEVRKLADGQSGDIPVIFGFSNVSLPPEASVVLPFGELRSASMLDLELVPEVAATTVEVILIAERPIRILHAERYAPTGIDPPPRFGRLEQFRPQMDEWRRETNRLADLTRWSFLLASPLEGLFALRHVFTSILEPLQSDHDLQWPNSEPFPPSPRAGLSQEALARVLDWAQRMKGHPRQLDIAMRRTLSAVSERTNPHDGLIDAVLAWENMFSDPYRG